MTHSNRSGALETIPGVGKATAGDLRQLGFRRVGDLASADPERMYLDLCRLTRSQQDRCVLYVFRCAVYYASRARHQAELLKWWNWKDRPLRPQRR